MSTKVRVNDLEQKLDQLSKRCIQHEQNAKALMDADYCSILSYLRDGVNSVQAIIQDLKKPQKIAKESEIILLVSFEYESTKESNISGACVEEMEITEREACIVPYAEDVVSLAERCTQITASFTKLVSSADKQLNDIMRIQLKATDFEVELDQLQEELDSTTTSAHNDVAQTQICLESRKNERRNIQTCLNTVATELTNVEVEMSDNKTQRKVVKVLKIGALVATPFFPPALGVAAGMQVGHMVLKDKKRDLTQQRLSANLQHQTLRTEIASLQAQNQDLETVLETNKKLSAQCGKAAEQVRHSERRLVCKANNYQALKEAAGNFLLWTETLQSRAEVMEDFDDGAHLGEMALRLVDDLSKCKRNDVNEICQPLRTLLLGEKHGSDGQLLLIDV